MLKIGVTGGLGSGKTAVSQAFARLGVPVIDTDEISRALTAADGAALPMLRKAFGDSIFNADGTLNRNALRALILNDRAAKSRLESILHPMILHEVAIQLARLNAPYVMIVVPLLVESGNYLDMLDRVLVVDCSEETQIQRALARGGWDESEIRAMMATQASRQARLKLADDVIHNDGGMDALTAQVAALNEKYHALARQSL
jgi:dephospho-CoA kinase